MNNEKCPIINLFSQISKMWVLQIIHQINLGDSTFSGLKKNLGSISSKTLSERLKELQDNGFVERRVTLEHPIKINYFLTKKGDSFSEETHNLNDWAAKWKY